VSGQSTIVVKLAPAAEGEDLRARLESAESFLPHRNPSAKWAMKGEGVVVTLYGSGKCVIQGPGAPQFAEAWLGEVPEAGGAALERLTEDVIGTDESGKGDYFGPLVVAAVLVPKGQEEVLATLGVRDSKELSDGAAAAAARSIRDGWPHEVVRIGPERYNVLYDEFGNLNRLLAWATAKAVEGVVREHPCRNVLSDQFGNERLIADALRKAGIEVNLTQRHRAESNPAVAAASILARDAFLSDLRRLGKVAGTKLPKGAGSPVLRAGKTVYREGGLETLGKVAKIHFKTTQRITSELF